MQLTCCSHTILKQNADILYPQYLKLHEHILKLQRVGFFIKFQFVR